MSRFRISIVLLTLLATLVPASAMAANQLGPFNIPDLDVLLQNISTQLPYLWQLMTAGAYILGFYCIFKSVYQLKQYGQGISLMSQQHSITGPVVMFVMGAALIWAPSSIKSMLTTVFGNDNILSYGIFTDIDPSFNLMGSVLTGIVSFVGLVAFIRGLLMFYHIGEGKNSQNQSFSKAFTHIVGGVLALNVVGTAKVIGSTLGITW